MQIIDISRPLSPRTACWPGDKAFSLEWIQRISQGALVNLSAITCSPHIGTHADAPLHVRDGALAIDDLGLEAFLGPARVIDVVENSDHLIHSEAFTGIDLSCPPRLLLRTGIDCDPERWPEQFSALAPEAAELLVKRKVQLLGLDTPSVDPVDSTALPAHTILADGGVTWLENLALDHVSPGLYELVALPLKIAGGDASPVRAVLVKREG
jgi:arylformamidase